MLKVLFPTIVPINEFSRDISYSVLQPVARKTSDTSTAIFLVTFFFFFFLCILLFYHIEFWKFDSIVEYCRILNKYYRINYRKTVLINIRKRNYTRMQFIVNKSRNGTIFL